MVVTDNLIENKIFRSQLHHTLFPDVESSCAQQCPADLKLGKEQLPLDDWTVDKLKSYYFPNNVTFTLQLVGTKNVVLVKRILVLKLEI